MRYGKTMFRESVSECVRRLESEWLRLRCTRKRYFRTRTLYKMTGREGFAGSKTISIPSNSKNLKQERWHRNLYTHSCGKRLIWLGEAAAWQLAWHFLRNLNFDTVFVLRNYGKRFSFFGAAERNIRKENHWPSMFSWEIGDSNFMMKIKWRK